MFNSCQDDIFTDNVLKQKELNGIPQFSNQEQFLTDVDNYEATKVLPQTMSNIKTLSFASSLKSDNIEEEIEEDTLVYSDLLKEFLNDRYEIIIGDVFFKITSNGTFFTSSANYEILRKLEEMVVLVGIGRLACLQNIHFCKIPCCMVLLAEEVVGEG